LFYTQLIYFHYLLSLRHVTEQGLTINLQKLSSRRPFPPHPQIILRAIMNAGLCMKPLHSRLRQCLRLAIRESELLVTGCVLLDLALYLLCTFYNLRQGGTRHDLSQRRLLLSTQIWRASQLNALHVVLLQSYTESATFRTSRSTIWKGYSICCSLERYC
jgi:hypothetical protein